MFTAAQVNLYSTDVERGVAFYRQTGFTEVFRTPAHGPPLHVELTLHAVRVGIASLASAVADHGLDLAPTPRGRGMEIVLWTDDVDAALTHLVSAGATVLSPPHDWLDTLRVAWVADPDGNPVELVQRRES